MTLVSHGKPCAGNPHARFDEGASAPEEPRRKALLHKKLTKAILGLSLALAGCLWHTIGMCVKENGKLNN